MTAGDAPIVLASSPLVGAEALADVADALRAAGRTVALPPVPADVTLFVASVADVTTADSIVVGFSAAGPRLFAVAERSQPAGLVFLDARLPADGVAPDDEPAFAELLDALPQDAEARLPPWPEWWPHEVIAGLVPDEQRRAALVSSSPRTPRATFSQPIPAPEFGGPSAFVGLGDGYADAAAEARRRGWPTRVLDNAHHLWPVVRPREVARVLDEVARELVGGRR